MARNIHMLGISGSLRVGSRNTAALRWIGEHLPADTTFELADISDLPLYNRDVEQAGVPLPVGRVVDQVLAADAVLIATPEYNYSITGSLKNALDWLSRPPQALWAKPVAMFGVGGRAGTLRSQLHLREVLLHEEVNLVLRPEVLITIADAFDGDAFVGERAREQVGRVVEALRARALHQSSATRRALVVVRDADLARRAPRLLGEVLIAGTAVTDDTDAIARIEAGGFDAILIGPDVDAESRAMLAEVAMASPEHIVCVDFAGLADVAGVAVSAVHV